LEPSEDSTISREVIEKAQAGDERAFAIIVEISRPGLEALAYLRMGPQLRRFVEVDDVLQETYLRAYRLLRQFQYRDAAGLLSWLQAILENAVRDLARFCARKKRGGKQLNAPQKGGESSENGASGLLDLLPSPLASPSRVFRRQERFERVEKALNALSPEHREVLILARIQELPIHEIASRMNRSTDAVSMLLLRATQKMRAALPPTDSWHLPAGRIEGLAAWGDASDGSEGAGGAESKS
jgi:RNA polymerase sigma-70 factor (ECF subfamily)